MSALRFTAADWPTFRERGLAHDWHGLAWVSAQLEEAGIALERRLDGRFEKALARDGNAGRPRQGYISHLIGSAAPVVVAAQLHSRGRTRRRPFERALARWAADCATTEKTDLMLGAAGALVAVFPGDLKNLFIEPPRLFQFTPVVGQPA